MAFIFEIGLVTTHAEDDFKRRATFRWILQKKMLENTARIQVENPWPIPAIFHGCYL